MSDTLPFPPYLVFVSEQWEDLDHRTGPKNREWL